MKLPENKVLFDRQRQKIAQLIFGLNVPIRKLAAWIFPDSTVATLKFGFDGEKIRIISWRPYISSVSENFRMSEEEWHNTVISVNNMIDEVKKR